MKTTLPFIISLLIVLTSSQQLQIFQIEKQTVKVHWNWLQTTDHLQQKIALLHQKLDQQPIKQIQLSFTYCKDPKFISQQILTHPIKAEIIKINLDNCKVSSQNINNILQLIDKTYVRHLDLNLDSIQSSQIMGDIVGKKLSQLNLTNLRISMAFGIDSKGIIKFLSHQINPQIQQISLDFSNNQLPYNSLQSLKNYFSRFNIQNLKKVELNFNTNKIGEKGAETIGLALQQFINISHLKLQLYFNNLKTKGTHYITQLVKKLPKLSLLTLNFDLNYIQTEGGKYIGEALSSLEHLTILEIGVARKNFGFKGFNYIINSIQKFKNLKQFTLRSGVSRVGREGALILAHLLSHLQQLQYFNLEFVQNSILDEGIQAISEAIEKLPLLKNVQLNLGFNEARNYGMVKIIKMIEKRNFKTIKLGLSNNAFQDADIKLIVPYLKNILKACSQFEFQFLQTKISEPLMTILQSIFDESQKSGCSSYLYISNQQAVQRARAELEKVHNNDAISTQL